MANSVVKVMDVTDDMISDSLLLLVGEDGTVTPDQRTVESYLNSKNGPTNLQIMHIEKGDLKGIDVSIDNVTYMPGDINIDNVVEDIIVEGSSKTTEMMDEVARNLYAFRLDHDYTPLTSPKRTSPTHTPVEDELAKTLSILHGSDDLESSKMDTDTITQETSKMAETPTEKISLKVKDKEGIKLNQKEIEKKAAKEVKFKPKVIHTRPAKGQKGRPKKKMEDENEDEEERATSESDEEYESSEEGDTDVFDDENDSDFDIEEEIRSKQGNNLRKRIKSETKSPEKVSKRIFVRRPVKIKKEKQDELLLKRDAKQIEMKQEAKAEEKEKIEKIEKISDGENIEKTTEDSNKTEGKPEDAKTQDKKPPKKEKKVPKPIPNDFALFSTPDIIRTVGGKKPTTPGTPETPKTPNLQTTPKPAKIMQESRSKSISESRSEPSTPKHNRHSTESKNEREKDKDKHPNHQRSSTETKHKEGIISRHKEKDRRVSTDKDKSKRLSLEEKSSEHLKSEHKHSSKHESKKSEDSSSAESTTTSQSLSESNSSFGTTVAVAEVTNGDPSIDSSHIHLDTTGLDLDQSILDNINNDMISEDILYKVAQQLVSNTELQNAIDKGINEGVLDANAIGEAMEVQQPQQTQNEQNTSSSDIIKQGTQIVRPDGRIVVIPPIERPTTRSRNKRREDGSKLPFKNILKPLDDEHVSGNELDSSNEEEESEDDPNKLWCICNQPHNNRFMICCDSCEEWYHGKCVNITKTMGQQMEAEGKEWICIYCRDSNLKRPLAAAKRIRKASRNSRTSSDSSNSTKKPEGKTGALVPCVVCQKPARKNSIYCSENCILQHAQGIERVVVFERSTGTMLTGNKAPSAANLDQWLKQHPGYEVVRSAGKIVTSKPGPLTQSKLKIVKNPENEGVSLAVQKKGINIGVMKHSPKGITIQQTPQGKSVKYYKIFTKQVNPKEPRTKLIQPQPIPAVKPPHNTPGNTNSTGTTPVKVQKIVLPVTPKTPKQKEIPKEKILKTPKTKPEIEKTTPPPKQENIRENVQKTVFEQLMVRLKGIEDIKLTEEEVKNISIEIESQLYKCFGDTGQKYKNKYRSLIFNVKDAKNQTLWRRICEKSISPYELVRLSPDDMASQELAIWREREAKHQLDMIKKSELELLNCNRQYVLKTHKGEQVLEDNRPDKNDNAEVIKSLMEGSTLDVGDKDKRDSSKDKDRDRRGGSKHGHRDRDRGRDRDRKSGKDKEHRSHRSLSHDRDKEKGRKRSRSRDRARHKDKKKEKRSRSRSKERDRERHKKSSHKSSKHKKDIISSTEKLDKKSKEILEQLVDNKIVPPLEDRLWKHVPQEDIVPAPVDSDSDHEPSSTVTIPTPPRNQEAEEYQPSVSMKTSPTETKEYQRTSSVEKEEGGMSPPPKSKPQEIWRGTINMIDVAQISITAHEVSGDCAGLGNELPENLDIVGRISPDTVWDYIGKMKCSNSKIISLVRLNATNIEEKMPYLALYSYLSSRNRLGVVKSVNKAVKDFYILPLASQKPIPQALLPLNGPGFEESRPALLLGIIVRDKRKRPMLDLPVVATPKRQKVEVVVTPVAGISRSYTPPPLATPPIVKSDPRMTKLPMPPLPTSAAPVTTKPPPPPLPLEEEIEGGDEPYSPEDSDPDSGPIEPAPVAPVTVPDEPEKSDVTIVEIPDDSPERSPEYPEIPGLGDTPIFPASKQDLERQMEELNKKIEMQKSEITNITKNIATAATGTDIGSSALASIALPSNLQQILDSIKTIGASTVENAEPLPPVAVSEAPVSQTDLTIPLMIPKSFSRPLNNPVTPPPSVGASTDTIPLKLPNKPLIKPAFVSAPEKSSVLSSLSEEDLIRKAEEMLGDAKKDSKVMTPPAPNIRQSSPKRAKMDTNPSPIADTDDRVI